MSRMLLFEKIFKMRGFVSFVLLAFTISQYALGIILQTHDGYQVTDARSKAIIKRSKTLQFILEDASTKDGHTFTIPQDTVTGPVLQKIEEWCYYHRKHKTLQVPTRDQPPVSWDVAFLDRFKDDHNLLCGVMMSANYLAIENLLEICAWQVAQFIIGKSPEEIRETFGIENDFTPEEEAQVRQENEFYAQFEVALERMRQLDLERRGNHNNR